MSSPMLLGIIIQTTILIILSIGFTFTYQIEKFPNFAHVSISTIGTIITYTITQIWGQNPYLGWPVSALACGFFGVIFYTLIIQPMKKKGCREISLAIVSLAVAIIIGAFIGIYSYWAVVIHRSPPVYFMITAYDFSIFDLPGVAITAPITCATLVIFLQLFLSKTRLGIAMRAVSENEQLSSILGVNTFKVHLVSWFIIGALVGIGGAIIPLWRSTNVGFSDEFLIAVMAASLVGGIGRIYGAIIGGILVSLAMKGLTQVISDYIQHAEPLLYEFSNAVRGFEQLIPIGMIFLVLMIEPEGITGFLDKPHSLTTKIRVFSRAISNQRIRRFPFITARIN